MRKNYLRFLIALIGVAGLGISTKAQEVDQLKINIPYNFVVDGQTLAAGTYTLNRVSEGNTRALVLSNFDDREGVIILASLVESNYSNKPGVSFEQVAGQIFLSKIQTADHSFTIPVSTSAILEAAAKPHSAASASGSPAGSR